MSELSRLELTDPTTAPVYEGAFSRSCQAILHDKRDEVFIRLTLRMVPLMGGLMTALFYLLKTGAVHPLVPIAAYLAVWGFFVPPVILMLHNTMHRPFLKRLEVLDRALPYVMTFFFGMPTGYRAHHVGMHHAEDNMLADLSSTIRYQRDSVLHFLVYLARFFLFSLVELPLYLVRHKKKALAVRTVASELCHLGLIGGAIALDWRFGVTAFLVPYVTCRLMMMVGNWGQHAFINTARKNNGFANAVTCINTGYNRRCFNDGYHVSHHMMAARHWTDHPAELLKNRAKYDAEGAIVLEGVDFFMISVLLWLGRYDVLSRRVVRLGEPRSDAEVEAMLRERVKPVVTWSLESIGVGTDGRGHPAGRARKAA